MPRKQVTGVLLSGGIIILIAIGAFVLYSQFALDYTLENLKDTLEAVQEGNSSELQTRVYQASLQNMALDQITTKDADLQSVMLLELAARSVRDAMDQYGSARAGLYLTEILKEKSLQRSFFFQTIDALFHFIQASLRSAQNFWKYSWDKIQGRHETVPLEATGALILNEADKMEKSWKLKEAEQYYKEFLDRYQGRPERGFVMLSLAHLQIKMRKLDEALNQLGEVRRQFPGTREESMAVRLQQRVLAVQKRLSKLGELENKVQAQPDSFSGEGGLELALNYVATYQFDKAISVLGKLSDTGNPRIKNKALFYLGWIKKWQGDPDQGKKIFEMLENTPQVDKKMSDVVNLQLADISFEKKEYKEAVERYEDLGSKAASETWKALSELEQSNIYLIGLNDAEQARQHFQRLQSLVDTASTSGKEILKKQLQEALDSSLREEAFADLASGNVDRALKKFVDYRKKFSRDGRAYSALASIELLKGRLEKALEPAEKGFGLTRDEYTATVLGYVFEKMKKYEDAKKYYIVGMQIKPSYIPARFNLAWVLLELKSYKNANQLLEALQNGHVRLPRAIQAKVLNNRGCALWGLGKREDAVSQFREALRVLPDLREAKNNLNLAAGEKPVAAGI